MSRIKRLALLLISSVLPVLVVGDALAGGGFFPSIPQGWVLNPSKQFTAEIVLDPNGPVGTGVVGATPTGTFGVITIERKETSATAVFQVNSFSSLGDLTRGCDLSLTNARFLEVTPGQPGLPLGGPNPAGNWLPTFTTISLFSQLGVSLVDPATNTVVMIPGVTKVISQACAPFPASYPNPSGHAGFLILEVKLGFWAAPGTPTPK